MINAIDTFAVTTNGIKDYIGFLEASLIESDSYRATMVAWCFNVEIDGTTYLRMGVKGSGGTLLTKEEFQPYFLDYGHLMITNKEYGDLLAEQAEEDFGT